MKKVLLFILRAMISLLIVAPISVLSFWLFDEQISELAQWLYDQSAALGIDVRLFSACVATIVAVLPYGLLSILVYAAVSRIPGSEPETGRGFYVEPSPSRKDTD